MCYGMWNGCCNEGYGYGVVGFPIDEYSHPLPPATAINHDDIPALSDNAFFVGVDTDRHKPLIQDDDDGAVYRLYMDGSLDAEEVFPTGSDAADETLRWVKFNPSWGFASARSSGKVGDPGYPDCNRVFSLDSDGNFVQGPYVLPLNAFRSYMGDHAVDQTGNVYYLGEWEFDPDLTFADPIVYDIRSWIYKNGARYGFFESHWDNDVAQEFDADSYYAGAPFYNYEWASDTAQGGQSIVGSPMFHDGANLYAYATKTSATGNTGDPGFDWDGTGLFKVIESASLDSNDQLQVLQTDLRHAFATFDENLDPEPFTYLYDASTVGGLIDLMSLYGGQRFTINLDVNRYIGDEDHQTGFAGQIFLVVVIRA